MIRFAVSCSVLALSAGAMAAPFALISYEAGGGLPGIIGQGFSVNRGGFFVADGAGGNVDSGGASNFNAGNEQEFDSYFAQDQRGPTVRNRTAATANNSNLTLSFYGQRAAGSPVNADPATYDPRGGAANDHNQGELIAGFSFIVGPGSHVGDAAGDGALPENRARAGVGVAPPPVFSGFAPNATGGRSAFEGVFMGRFTIQSGAELTGGAFVTVQFGPGEHYVLNGAPVAQVGQLYGLRSYKVGSVDLQTPSSATADGVNNGTPFGLADVYDVWFQVIPTPGAAALAGLAGLAGLRRRRA